jgi:calcineurin-like phosphoesterase family protein
MWYASYMTIFRDDIDPETTWVISDTHFGHENIKAFCHRPSDVEQTIMEEWARTVPESGSTLLHLGDLSYRGNALFKNLIAPHLTGERKLLVQGNHDKQRYSFYRDSGFQIVKPFSITYRGYEISFSHYPWNPEFDGTREPPASHRRLHGHIHNNGYTREAYVPFVRRQINLSCEQTKYRPVNLKLLLDGELYGELPVHPEAARTELSDEQVAAISNAKRAREHR